MNNCRATNKDNFTTILFGTSYIFCNFFSYMLCRSFTRTSTSHKFKYIHSFSRSFWRNYFNTIFSSEDFITFFYLANRNAYSFFPFNYNTFVHHHVINIDPFVVKVNLCWIICCTVKIIRHYHIFCCNL